MVGLERAAFTYAMVEVNGQPTKVSEMAWENYLAEPAPVKASSLRDAMHHVELMTGRKVLGTSLEDGVLTTRLSGTVHPVGVVATFSTGGES